MHHDAKHRDQQSSGKDDRQVGRKCPVEPFIMAFERAQYVGEKNPCRQTGERPPGAFTE